MHIQNGDSLNVHSQLSSGARGLILVPAFEYVCEQPRLLGDCENAQACLSLHCLISTKMLACIMLIQLNQYIN